MGLRTFGHRSAHLTQEKVVSIAFLPAHGVEISRDTAPSSATM